MSPYEYSLRKRGAILLSLLAICMLVFLLAGCESLKPKPIWTQEGWQAYKDDIKNTFSGILKVILWGLVPSALGVWTSFARRRLVRNKIGKGVVPHLVVAAGPFVTAVIVFTYIKTGHWVWGGLSVVCFFVGLAGVLIYPADFEKDE